MDKKEIFDKILAIIKPFAKNEAAFKAATEQSIILRDLQVNSARLVDIILAFEDEFKIEIDDAAADKVRTLGDAVALVDLKTSK